MRAFYRFYLLSIIFLVFASPTLNAADRAKTLSPQYRHWIEQEVPYIIDSAERKQFLALRDDAERENFIRAFWDARNPNPGSGSNPYKEEHYRRLAYANEHFGTTASQNGWRTDQGQIYITLGEPQQRANYPNARNVRPLQIWFYQSPTPALPTHFYVVFYKRSASEPYTLYSPYQDGPTRLTTGLEDLNVQNRSIKTIRDSLGDEVARTTLSLIPTEPVDLTNYSPSMTSDVLLSKIRGLADDPMTKEMLAAHRSKEVVTSNLLLAENQADLEAATFRDQDGRQTVHYLIVPHGQMQDLIGSMPGGKVGYSLKLEASVVTRSGNSVYKTEDALKGVVTEDQAAQTRHKRFAAEGRLPLAPGEYKLTVTLTNELTHTALSQSRALVVPNLSTDGWNMSRLLVFSARSAGQTSAKLPFTFTGVRFAPRGLADVPLHPLDPLWLAFQIWDTPRSSAATPAPARKIRMTYSYGRLQGGLPPVTVTEDVDSADFNASGSYLTGYKISTAGLEQGSYRLVVTAAEVGGDRRAYASMQFRIVPDSEPTDLWTAYTTEGAGARSDAMDDYKRGLSALAGSQDNIAMQWFQKTLSDDPQYVPAVDHLVEILARSKRFQEIATLSLQHPATNDLKERTVILMAQADGQIGDPIAGTRILEAELRSHPPSSDLCLELSRLYQAAGNSDKAQELKRRAEALKN